jgi:hypothetical protein
MLFPFDLCGLHVMPEVRAGRRERKARSSAAMGWSACPQEGYLY